MLSFLIVPRSEVSQLEGGSFMVKGSSNQLSRVCNSQRIDYNPF